MSALFKFLMRQQPWYVRVTRRFDHKFIETFSKRGRTHGYYEHRPLAFLHVWAIKFGRRFNKRMKFSASRVQGMSFTVEINPR